MPWPKRILAAALIVHGLGSPAPAAEPGRGERLQQALLSAEKGDWQWARHLADDVGVPALRTYFRWREFLESDDRPSFTSYHEFLRREGDWPSLGAVQTRAEEAIEESVPFAQRLAFFDARPPRTRQGRVRYAEAL